jgi:dephospho-CoA kinase
MLWVGLTGGIASGKTSVAKQFVELGIPVVDADQISHDLMKKETTQYQTILQVFGLEILDAEGQIDRRKLGAIVFSNREKLLKLESILHPAIQEKVLELRKKFEAEKQKFAVYDVPLLFEKKLMDQFDLILVVNCSEENQRARLKVRNSLTSKEIENRLKSQLPMAEKIKKANFIIENNSGFEDLRNEVLNTVKKISSI